MAHLSNKMVLALGLSVVLSAILSLGQAKRQGNEPLGLAVELPEEMAETEAGMMARFGTAMRNLQDSFVDYFNKFLAFFGLQSKGDTGVTGDIGAAGTNVLASAKGPSGNQGGTGAYGDTGATGDMGAAGTNGLAGVKGPSGNQGGNGAKGDTGVTGDVGAAGTNGVAGAKGPSGNQAETQNAQKLVAKGAVDAQNGRK